MASVAVVVIYFAATSLIALAMARRNRSSKEFFLGSSGFGVAFVVSMTFSETVGGTATIGDCAEAMASIGLGAMWATWGIALGCVCFVFAFGKLYRVLGQTAGACSVASVYGILFGKRTKAVVLVVIAVVYTCFFALQPVAAASLLAPMLGVNRGAVYLATGLLFVVIACLGGLKGLAKMNKVHAFVMWLGLLIVALAVVQAVGGPHAVTERAPSGYLNPFNPGVVTVAIWLGGGVLSQMSSAVIAMITLSADGLPQAKRGVLVAAVLLMAFAVFVALIGVVGAFAFPEVDPRGALYAVAFDVSPVLGTLCAVAIVAAIFSSAPSLLLIVGTTVAEDLYRTFVNPQASDKTIVAMARGSMVVAGVIALIMGAQTTSIFSQLISIFQIRSIAAVVLIVALVWKRVDDRAAFWSILSGGFLAALWHFLGSPFGIQPLVPALFVGLGVLIPLTVTARDKVARGYREYLAYQLEYLEKGHRDVSIDPQKARELLSERE